MTPYKLIVGKGNIVTGEHDYVWLPRKIRGSTKYPVILHHGAEAGATPGFQWHGTSWPSAHKLAVALAMQGIPVIAGKTGGNTFGNDAVAGTGVNDYTNKMLTYISAQSGCSSTKAIVGGLSMGGLIAARWGSLNQSKAAGLFGLIPAVGAHRIYNENPWTLVAADASFAKQISLAFPSIVTRYIADGVTTNASTTITSATAAFTGADVGRKIVRGYDQTAIQADTTIVSVTNGTTVVVDKAATASTTAQRWVIADPLTNLVGTAGLDMVGVHAPRILAASIPNRWYAATDDTLVTASDVSAFATAAGGTYYSGTGGHAEAAISQFSAKDSLIDWQGLINWIKVCGA